MNRFRNAIAAYQALAAGLRRTLERFEVSCSAAGAQRGVGDVGVAALASAPAH